MDRATFNKVIKQIPLLTNQGIGWGLNTSHGTLKDEQERLFKNINNDRKTGDKIKDFLESVKPQKTLNCNSYGLKHLCEFAMSNYTSNGEFILVAVSMGFPYKISANSVNCVFGMCKDDIDAVCLKNKNSFYYSHPYGKWKKEYEPYSQWGTYRNVYRSR